MFRLRGLKSCLSQLWCIASFLMVFNRFSDCRTLLNRFDRVQRHKQIYLLYFFKLRRPCRLQAHNSEFHPWSRIIWILAHSVKEKLTIFQCFLPFPLASFAMDFPTDKIFDNLVIHRKPSHVDQIFEFSHFEMLE